MRVIGGEFRSRRLKTLSGNLVRPTPDRLREALFNVLAPGISGKVFVDAYAGSGAVGIEAFSRGAKPVILIEKDTSALAVIRENLKSLSIDSGVTVVRGDAGLLLPKHDGDIAFIDPPYQRESEYENAMTRLAGMSCPLVIAQHDYWMKLSDNYDSLKKTRVMRQGDNLLTFFARSAES